MVVYDFAHISSGLLLPSSVHKRNRIHWFMVMVVVVIEQLKKFRRYLCVCMSHFKVENQSERRIKI